jgi:putative transposase
MHYYEYGWNKKKIAESHHVGRAVVYQWLKRWEDSGEQRQIWQKAYQDTQISRREYEKYLTSIFRDAPRSGTPRKFDETTIEKIISMAASDPQSLGLPFSRWSEVLLQKELIKRKVVKSISSSQVGRFLKNASNPTSP